MGWRACLVTPPGASARAASRMTSAVADGCETPTTWDEPAISTARLGPARSAMMRCAPTEMLRSWSPKTNQLGTVFHSGVSPDGSDRAVPVIGRCADRSGAIGSALPVRCGAVLAKERLEQVAE